MSDFSKLENIYRMFSPARELAAERLDPKKKAGDPNDPTSIVRRLQDLLVDVSNGSYGIKAIGNKLEDLGKSPDGVEEEEIKKKRQMLNKWVSFFSTELPNTSLSYQKAPNMHKVGEKVESSLKFHQICGLSKPEDLGGKPMSICLSRNGFVTPAGRDAGKVETFINFMPPMILSQLFPYMECEFVFDRAYENGLSDGSLTAPSMLKFLLGGKNLKEDFTADGVMYKSRRAYSYKKDSSGNQEQNPSYVHTMAGMELFTSPQTLINMDPIDAKLRYTPVLDPTRPFMSLESVAINIKGTKGVMSHKTGTMVIKIHDKTRLSEIADFIQPTAYGRSTIWLTYGWRYNSSGMDPSGTYEEFINNNMLLKEAYGVSNSSFSFDASGQVTLTLQLTMKNGLEIRRFALNEDAEFLKLKRQQEETAKTIAELQQILKIETPGNISKGQKEVRAFSVLSAAGDNTFPALKPAEVDAAITELESALKRKPQGNAPGVPPTQANKLIENLRKYYFGESTSQNSFNFKEKCKDRATQIVQEKFTLLRTTPDPFLVSFPEKQTAMLQDDMGYGQDVKYPYLEQIKNYSDLDPVQGDARPSEIPKSVVSFGKLFAVFLTPSLLAIESVSEYQLLFYNLNDLAGLASGTNIAEFAIDLVEFMMQYTETLIANATTVLTVEQFVQLAVNAQISDLRAIPYGFRNEGLFSPWKAGVGAAIKDDSVTTFNSVAMSFNKGRGGFRPPVVEVLLEVTNISETGNSGDPLKTYESSDPIKSPFGSTNNRVMKIHVFDKSASPYRLADNMLKSNTPGTTTFYTIYDPFDPYLRNAKVEVRSAELSGTGAEKEKTYIRKLAGSDNVSISTTKIDGGPSDWETIKRAVSKTIPTIVIGTNGSTIYEANFATQADAKLNAAQMIAIGTGAAPRSAPRGSGVNNLPLIVIPGKLSLKMLGIPIIGYTQQFFVDFGTGTTIDNIYGVSSITHTFVPGKFDTALEFAFHNAYGIYQSAPSIMDMLKHITEEVKNLGGGETAAPGDVEVVDFDSSTPSSGVTGTVEVKDEVKQQEVERPPLPVGGMGTGSVAEGDITAPAQFGP